MKKLFLSLILMTGVFALVHAQGVDFGIKAGLNMAKLNIEEVDDVDMKAGLHIGAFLNLNLSDNFAISPEVLFSQQGGKMGDDKLNLNYVNVPVLAKIRFAKILNVHFGPQFGFLMSAKFDDIDIKDAIKAMDISGVAGLGLELPLGLTGGARYNFGFGDIAESNNSIELTKTTNQYFQIYVGYKLF